MTRRNKSKLTRSPHITNEQLVAKERVVSALLGRIDFASRFSRTYKGKRDLNEALGYPDTKDLTFDYYYNKYDRNELAAAVIDRPVNKTWDGDLMIIEENKKKEESKLSKEWELLNEQLKVKKNLVRLDKLSGIGEFGVLLFGFSDVKDTEDFKTPVGGIKLKLNYIKPLSQSEVTINEWETDTSNERYGLPKVYTLTVGAAGVTTTKNIEVHHSRVLHITAGSLTSDVYGRPRLKPIINRLLDYEKVLGGDAEMFWRGARPGYTALSKDNYEMDTATKDALHEELDMYEHDLRRIITGQGIDIEALEQQIADPVGHVDVQIQAISVETGIPKRILVGSERGELASSQDREAWLSLIKTRMEEYAEPEILRPFIDKCMETGILPKVEKYNVMWEDLFSPSEKDKVEVGKERATSLKAYADSMGASDILPAEFAYKYILGLTEEQIDEVQKAAEALRTQEDLDGAALEEEVNAEIERRAQAAARAQVIPETLPQNGDTA